MNLKRFSKINKFQYGLITGLLFPILGFFIAFLVKGGDSSLLTFWKILMKDQELLTNVHLREIYTETRQSILMFCLLANMLLFYFSFFIYKIDYFSKGLVGVTLLLTALSIIFIY